MLFRSGNTTMIFYLTIALLASAAYGNPCAGLENGAVPEWGCKSYTYCLNGSPVQVDCVGDKVYNDAIKACDDITNVGPPCGLWRDCTGKTGQYADLDLDCKGYYTCNGGYFMGHIMCAEGTVFDERDASCTWPYLVPPPCGTCSDC